ncbi:hypothetical protein JCM8097_007517 [Rhodosporidiobolus ruineniae]
MVLLTKQHLAGAALLGAASYAVVSTPCVLAVHDGLSDRFEDLVPREKEFFPALCQSETAYDNLVAFAEYVRETPPHPLELEEQLKYAVGFPEYPDFDDFDPSHPIPPPIFPLDHLHAAFERAQQRLEQGRRPVHIILNMLECMPYDEPGNTPPLYPKPPEMRSVDGTRLYAQVEQELVEEVLAPGTVYTVVDVFPQCRCGALIERAKRLHRKETTRPHARLMSVATMIVDMWRRSMCAHGFKIDVLISSGSIAARALQIDNGRMDLGRIRAHSALFDQDGYQDYHASIMMNTKHVNLRNRLLMRRAIMLYFIGGAEVSVENIYNYLCDRLTRPSRLFDSYHNILAAVPGILGGDWGNAYRVLGREIQLHTSRHGTGTHGGFFRGTGDAGGGCRSIGEWLSRFNVPTSEDLLDRLIRQADSDLRAFVFGCGFEQIADPDYADDNELRAWAKENIDVLRRRAAQVGQALEEIQRVDWSRHRTQQASPPPPPPRPPPPRPVCPPSADALAEGRLSRPSRPRGGEYAGLALGPRVVHERLLERAAQARADPPPELLAQAARWVRANFSREEIGLVADARRSAIQNLAQDEVWQMAPEQLNQVLDSAWTKFCNVDGLDARSVIAIPGQVAHGPFVDPKMLHLYDNMTIAERLAEVRERKLLTDLEYKCFVPWLRDGQTVWARAIFHDALDKGKLAYSFDTPVSEIQDLGRSVKVVTSNGTFEAAKVICTTPLNVTNQIKFSPPLSPVRKEAFDVGSVAFAHKIHAVMSDPSLRCKSWSAFDTREAVGMASGLGIDYTKDKKSSIIVAFGADSSDLDKQASKHPELINEWLGKLDPELKAKHQRSIWHEWVTDPWLKGGWSAFGTGFYTKYWAELVKPHGNVTFASAGARAARDVLKAAPRPSSL